MNEAQKIIDDILKNNLSPIYFLMGDEPFFIDWISNIIENNVLSDFEKEFNQLVIYGRDTSAEDIIGYARQFPMGADKRVIIVREAQELEKNIEKLSAYAENPSETTILVLCYKFKKIDARKKLAKELKKYVLFESKKLYDNQVPAWIVQYLKPKNFTISAIATQMLVDYLGNDLKRIANELDKIQITLAKNSEITPEIIEKYVGISKNFNIFELQNALGTKNEVKAFQIVKYFAENQKDAPIVSVVGALYNYFEKLFIYHGTADKSDNNLAKVLGVHSFFVKDYHLAARNYPMKKVSQSIEAIRQADTKSKGVEAGSISYEYLLKELIYNIIR